MSDSKDKAEESRASILNLNSVITDDEKKRFNTEREINLSLTYVESTCLALCVSLAIMLFAEDFDGVKELIGEQEEGYRMNLARIADETVERLIPLCVAEQFRVLTPVGN